MATSVATAPVAGPVGAPTPGAGRSRRSVRQTLSALTFLTPNLVLVGMFLLFPLVMSFVISAQQRQSLGVPTWVGLENYAQLLRDPLFWESLRNTVVFTVLTVPTSMALGLGCALLVNGALPGRLVYRSVIFLPMVISGVATGILGLWMFDQYSGFVNKMLAAFGLAGPNWQSDGGWAMASIVLMTIWVRLGFDMLIYLAGLQSIDPQLREAARLDGAGPWQELRRITVPLLGPSTFFLLVMNLIYSFQIFDTVFAMTNGGPDYSTTMLVTYAYKTGFDERGPGELGYAAAVGVVIFLITLVITGLQWRLSRNRDVVS
ncbi:MAG TPA: sugar ABC transporter permease [Propionibacteriaceae bacterium]